MVEVSAEVLVKQIGNHMIDMSFGRNNVGSVEFNIAVETLPVLLAVESLFCTTNIFASPGVTSDN